jgi:hypothetical protein
MTGSGHPNVIGRLVMTERMVLVASLTISTKTAHLLIMWDGQASPAMVTINKGVHQLRSGSGR